MQIVDHLPGRQDLPFELVELIGRLSQQGDDGAAAGRARQGALAGLVAGHAAKTPGGNLDVGQQGLGGQRVLMGTLEPALVLLDGIGQVLLDRRRPGQRRGVQPGRHGDDGAGADDHGHGQPEAGQHATHHRQEFHQVGPEAEDRHADGDRVDQRATDGEQPVGIQQPAHAHIGPVAGSDRQDAERGHGRGVERGQGLVEVAGVLLGHRRRPSAGEHGGSAEPQPTPC